MSFCIRPLILNNIHIIWGYYKYLIYIFFLVTSRQKREISKWDQIISDDMIQQGKKRKKKEGRQVRKKN
jgi:hypothetical protein